MEKCYTQIIITIIIIIVIMATPPQIWCHRKGQKVLFKKHQDINHWRMISELITEMFTIQRTKCLVSRGYLILTKYVEHIYVL